MKIAMLNGRVLLKLKEGDSMTKSGLLVIPDTGKDAPQIGVVHAVHAGYNDEGESLPPMTRLGDQVIFGRYDGTELEIDNEKYLSIREKDLHAIISAMDEPLEQSGQ